MCYNDTKNILGVCDCYMLELILCIIYIALFCVPAFMLTWERDGSFGGCSGFVCIIIGFPGTLMSAIIKAILNSNKSKQLEAATNEREKTTKERNEKAEEFAVECKNYIKNINNSKTIKYIAQLVANCNQTYDCLKVESCGIYCCRYSTRNWKCIITFDDYKIKDLSPHKLVFKGIPGVGYKEQNAWFENFKYRHKDIVGLSLESNDYEWDDSYFVGSLCLDERVVVGYALIRLLKDEYLFESKNFETAVFRKKTLISDTHRNWT